MINSIMSYIYIYPMYLTIIIFMQSFVAQEISLTKRCVLLGLAAEGIVGVFFVLSIIYYNDVIQLILIMGLLFGIFPLIIIKVNDIPKAKKKNYTAIIACVRVL